MPPRAGRRSAALALVAVVTLWHLWAGQWVAEQRIGPGSADRVPRRIEVAFVRELKPATPPTVVSRSRPAARPVARTAPPPVPPEAVASAPPAVEPEPALPPAPAPAPSAPAELPIDLALDLALDLSLPADPDRPPFEWPPSTRLSYSLTGNYRGPVEGSASVEWVRDGSHYQVHLDVVIGASLAPLITRQMSSDGTLGPDGLQPQRYDERTKWLLRDPVRTTLRFGAEWIELAGRRRAPRPAGVQDAVSQFVQLTWQFTRDPSLLQAGRVIELPLALPRQVHFLSYEVQPAQTLWTPAGPVQAVRLLPRQSASLGGDLVAEPWFAPSLQYLPVRIVIRQDEQTYVDLLIERLPQQATPEPIQPASRPDEAGGQSRLKRAP